MMDWEDVLFKSISTENYVIIRNYEEFSKDDFLENHPDIDLLCERREAIIQKLKLTPRGKKDDKIHYKAIIYDREIPIDLRCIDDGYLDSSWERDILSKRVRLNGFYVMDRVNYFYALLYHAYLQKNYVSPDYEQRLTVLGKEIGVEYTQDRAIQLLNFFMHGKGYKYTIPEYIGTIANFNYVDQTLIAHDPKKEFERKLHAIRVKLAKMMKG